MSNLPYPKIMKPRTFRDGLAWLRVFHARVDRIQAPFYGVNIWRVKKHKLAKSISLLINLASPGLNHSYGKIHYIDTFKVNGCEDVLDVVLIYDWHSLPQVIDDAAPFSILPIHFRFMASVESYNWNLVKDLGNDPAHFASLLTHKFHLDICDE